MEVLNILLFIATIYFFYYNQQKYKKITQPARARAYRDYLKSVQKDIKKYRIPKEYIEGVLNPNGESPCYYWTGFIWGLVGAILAMFFLACFYGKELEKFSDQGKGLMLTLCFWAAWIIVGHSMGKQSCKKSNIKQGVKQSYEDIRCPHCGCPFVYKQIDSYKTDEKHYLKRKTRKEMINGHDYTFTDDVPMTSYIQHDVYECAICHTKDEETTNHEFETN